jgi:class 3 adenylate cyclase
MWSDIPALLHRNDIAGMNDRGGRGDRRQNRPHVEPEHRFKRRARHPRAGAHALDHGERRALRTVLFTDMVASTQRAAAAGDERWRAMLHRFDEITVDRTRRFGGTIVERTGHGHVLTFNGPTQAIRCAEALRADAETLVSRSVLAFTPASANCWTTVSAGSRYILRRASSTRPVPGQILVSGTVRDLVVGSGTGFEDRGSVELRGVPGTWQLLAVDRHGPRAGSPEAELASMPRNSRSPSTRSSTTARCTPCATR